MRLIDADALDVVGTIIPSDADTKSYIMGMEYILNKIDSMPTIEERKQGEWIYGERKRLTDLGYITEKYWKCSACGNAKGFRAIKPLDNFCLFCGADMRGKDHVAD